MIFPVVIIGGGGHAKVLLDILRLRSREIYGVLDSNPEKVGSRIGDLLIIGDDTLLSEYDPRDLRLVNGVGSIDVPNVRKKVFEKFKSKGYIFETVVHPSAIIASDVRLGEGAQIMASAVVQPGSSIGANTIVNTKVSVDHDCLIGDHVHLAPGVTLSGNIRVGNSVHIGTGATVINGVAIGTRSMIGAGSLVVRNIPESSRVFGVPAEACSSKNY